MFGARYTGMPLRQTKEETEDDSTGLLGRVKGKTEEGTDEASTGRFGRARAKYGLGALLVGAGVVLFLFPEPVTSTAGIALIGVGALIWLVSWLR